MKVNLITASAKFLCVAGILGLIVASLGIVMIGFLPHRWNETALRQFAVDRINAADAAAVEECLWGGPTLSEEKTRLTSLLTYVGSQGAVYRVLTVLQKSRIRGWPLSEWRILAFEIQQTDQTRYSVGLFVCDQNPQWGLQSLRLQISPPREVLMQVVNGSNWDDSPRCATRHLEQDYLAFSSSWK